MVPIAYRKLFGVTLMRYAFIAAAVFAFVNPAAAGSTALILQICQNDKCEKHDITPPAENITLFACAMVSQQLAAQWMMQNKPPSWQVRKIICTDATRTADL